MKLFFPDLLCIAGFLCIVLGDYNVPLALIGVGFFACGIYLEGDHKTSTDGTTTSS